MVSAVAANAVSRHLMVNNMVCEKGFKTEHLDSADTCLCAITLLVVVVPVKFDNLTIEFESLFWKEEKRGKPV